MKKRYTEEQIIGFLREADAHCRIGRNRCVAGKMSISLTVVSKLPL